MKHAPNADGLNKMIDNQIGDFVTTLTDNILLEEVKASPPISAIPATDLSLQDMAILHLGNEVAQMKDLLKNLCQFLTVELRKLK